MCDKCHRFFIISYEKNEKGEVVEVGHELDIQVKSSGAVRVDEGDHWKGPERSPPGRRYGEETCW
jgi:hypothetical protein